MIYIRNLIWDEFGPMLETEILTKNCKILCAHLSCPHLRSSKPPATQLSETPWPTECGGARRGQEEATNVPLWHLAGPCCLNCSSKRVHVSRVDGSRGFCMFGQNLGLQHRPKLVPNHKVFVYKSHPWVTGLKTPRPRLESICENL